jgi:hypothetical protein
VAQPMPEPDEFSATRSAKLCEFYKQYRTALDALPDEGQWLPYRWYNLPNPLNGFWTPYALMLEEYSIEIASSINKLTDYTRRLRAWISVVCDLNDEEKFELTHEFLDMLGTTSLGLPYVIKSRFIFAAANLSNQANISKISHNWKDEISKKKNLHLDDIGKICSKWAAYSNFRSIIRSICGESFKIQTDNFRNVYNHAFSPRLIFGEALSATRRVDQSGRVSHEIRNRMPLDLNVIADALDPERRQCYLGFGAFQALVREQLNSITGSDAAENGRAE